MFRVHTLHDPGLNEDHRKAIEKFCKIAELETDNPAIENIRFEGWRNNTASLMYAIDRGRFDSPNGTFQMVIYGTEQSGLREDDELSDDEPVCLAGAYLSDFDPQVALVGCRAWTIRGYRSEFRVGDYIVPLQLDWAVQSGADIAMFTFAPYNAWLAKLILRASAGRALLLGRGSSPAYQGWVAHPVLCRIKETDQIVLYKQLGVIDRIPDLREIETKTPSGLD